MPTFPVSSITFNPNTLILSADVNNNFASFNAGCVVLETEVGTKITTAIDSVASAVPTPGNFVDATGLWVDATGFLLNFTTTLPNQLVFLITNAAVFLTNFPYQVWIYTRMKVDGVAIVPQSSNLLNPLDGNWYYSLMAFPLVVATPGAHVLQLQVNSAKVTVVSGQVSLSAVVLK